MSGRCGSHPRHRHHARHGSHCDSEFAKEALSNLKLLDQQTTSFSTQQSGIYIHTQRHTVIYKVHLRMCRGLGNDGMRVSTRLGALILSSDYSLNVLCDELTWHAVVSRLEPSTWQDSAGIWCGTSVTVFD